MSIDIKDRMTKSYKPENHGIPADYQHWQGDSCEDYIGPFFFRMEGDIAGTAFRVQEHNCNAHKIVHGGMLMTFADYTLCMAALGGSNDSVVTVTCNNEFIGPAFAGDLVMGRGEVTRRGGSLIFTRVTLEANGKTILTASGVVKRLRPQQ
jgi:uncharacterized protein (TIGR00369 family)